jgi:hypothetical protein
MTLTKSARVGRGAQMQYLLSLVSPQDVVAEALPLSKKISHPSINEFRILQAEAIKKKERECEGMSQLQTPEPMVIPDATPRSSQELYEEVFQQFQIKFCREGEKDYREYFVAILEHANPDLTQCVCLLPSTIITHDPLPSCRDTSYCYKRYKFHKGNFMKHVKAQHLVFLFHDFYEFIFD